jgi:hypothetical protein
MGETDRAEAIRRDADAPQPDSGPTDVFMLIHGIRTQASWTEMVASLLENERHVVVQPIRYGYFDTFRFLFPFWTRRKPVERIVREYRDLRLRYPDARISAIAHSFGTYALAKAVQEPDVVFDRVILCGSIIPENFRKAQYRSQFGTDLILNDCGTHDIWPVLAKSVTWGYGATGTFGFGSAGIRDRFSKFTHSAYFTREFVRDYWLPYLREGKVVGTQWEVERSNPPYWQSLLGILPIRWLFPLALVAAVYFGAMSWFRTDPPALRLADQILVGHWLGVPHVLARARLVNASREPAQFLVLGARLLSPNQRQVLIGVEQIRECDGRFPLDLRIGVEARRASECTYALLGDGNDLSPLWVRLNAILQEKQLFQAQPDPARMILDEALLKDARAMAERKFLWTAGNWTMRIEYQVSGRTQFETVEFSLTEEDVAALKSTMEDYATGFGIYPNWRYLSRDGRNETMRPVTVRFLPAP